MRLTTAISLYGGGPGSGCNPAVAEPRCGRPSEGGGTGSSVIRNVGFRSGTGAGRVWELLRDGQPHTRTELQTALRGNLPPEKPGPRLDWQLSNMGRRLQQAGYRLQRGREAGTRVPNVRVTPQSPTAQTPTRPATPPAKQPPTQAPLPRFAFPRGMGDSRHAQDILQDGAWHNVSDLKQTLRAGPLPDTTTKRVNEQLQALDDRARQSGYQLERRTSPVAAEGEQVRLSRLPEEFQSRLGRANGSSSWNVERVLSDGQWHTRAEITSGVSSHTDVGLGLRVLTSQAPNHGYTLEKNPDGRIRLTRTGAAEQPAAPAPASKLPALPFTPGGRAEAGANLLRDGQWHTREEFDRITMAPSQEHAHGIVDAEGALRSIGNRARQNGMELQREGNQVRLVRSTPTETPAARPTPTTPPAPPAHDARQAVGFMKTENNPSMSEIHSAGIQIGAANIEAFKRDFQMSPIDYKNAVLKGLDANAAKDATLRIEHSGTGQSWQITTDTKSFNQSRSFDLEKGTVYHGYWTMKAGWEGKDVGKQVFGNQLDLYDHLGIKSLSVGANLSVGGYAWARYGFVPDRSDWNRLKDFAVTKGDRLGLSADVKAQLRVISTIDDPRGLWVLAALRDAKGDSVGKKILLGQSWHGKINLDNKENYTVLKAYVKEHDKKIKSAAMEAEPVYVVGGQRTDAPFHNSLLKSDLGRRLSDELAIKIALKNGWTRQDARKWFSGQWE